LGYVEDRAHVTDGTAEIGKADAVSLNAPPMLFSPRQGVTAYPAAQAPMDLNAPVVDQGTWNVLNTQKGPSFSTRYQGQLANDTITNLLEHTVTAGVVEGIAPDGDTTNRYSRVDKLSTLGFRLTYQTKSQSKMVSYHVCGSPYLTIGYGGMTTPFFNSNYQLFHIFSDQNKDGVAVIPGQVPTTPITGSRFTALYQTGEHVFTVILYASQPITLGFAFRDDYKTAVPGTVTSGNFVASKDAPAGTPVYSSFAVATGEVGKLVAQAAFHGIVRLVNLAPVATSGSVSAKWLADWQGAQAANAALIQAYDQNVDVIPLSGEPAIPDSGTWSYAYTCTSMKSAADPTNLTAGTTPPPLIAMIAADRDHFSGTVLPGATAGSVKGTLYFATANPLTFQIKAPAAEWFDDAINVVKGLTSEAAATLVQQLTDDVAVYPAGLTGKFADGWQKTWAGYPIGKELTQVGTLIRFAAKVLKDSGKSESEIQTAVAPALAVLESCLEKVLAEGLLYDATTGMVIESSSLGNAPYYAENYFNIASQDQIFHYGYFVTAAALVADMDAAWLQKKLPSGAGTYRDVVDCVVRNVSSPSTTDPYFAPWRSMNWSQGHATASGLNAMYGDGPNEESFAEEGNYWQGLVVWAKLTGNTTMSNVAGVGLARCAEAVKAFVESGSSRCAYSAEVQAGLLNNTYFSVCNIFSKKNQAATWFGGDRPVAIGIEVFTCIPALLDSLVDAAWLGKVYGYYHQPGTGKAPLLFEKVDALGEGYSMWYSNLSPMFAMTDPAFVVDIMNYKNFRLDDSGIGLNTRGVLAFNLAYREATLQKFAGMPKYMRPVPWFEAQLMGSLKGWTAFLDPKSPNSPINPDKNPPAEQLALMMELFTQMVEWVVNTPLSGGTICQWATTTHDQFHAK
ncbi:MAG TPA: glycosyl hydrolase, partial [Candidatus Acidoferrum sp.]|nr:glycosyl hydrolase [Candidatus Acidoferrum sp.]